MVDYYLLLLTAFIHGVVEEITWIQPHSPAKRHDLLLITFYFDQ